MAAYPHELSGGMLQRAMIAMALLCDPKLLILDEPTTALDVTVARQILRLILRLQREAGFSVVLITHNLGIVRDTCDRVGVLYAGRVIETGATDDVLDHPRHPYTRGLMEALPGRHDGHGSPRSPDRCRPTCWRSRAARSSTGARSRSRSAGRSTRVSSRWGQGTTSPASVGVSDDGPGLRPARWCAASGPARTR